MYTLYSMQRSGNCYKVRLTLAQLVLPYRLVELDILKGETRTPDFLARNPSGQLPLLEIGPGKWLPESNAILWFLADGTRLLPDDPLERTQVLRWMFFEQNSHEPNISQARFWLSMVKGGRELRTHDIDGWMERGYDALIVMDRHLSNHDWFGAERYSIADIALYAETHLAHEGGFDLASFPRVRRWLARVAAEPGHVAIGHLPERAAAR